MVLTIKVVVRQQAEAENQRGGDGKGGFEHRHG
jgi:hypothetical protein